MGDRVFSSFLLVAHSPVDVAKKKREARFSERELWTANDVLLVRNTACLLELASTRMYGGQPINIEECFYALKCFIVSKCPGVNGGHVSAF